jgi:hypothetical protein
MQAHYFTNPSFSQIAPGRVFAYFLGNNNTNARLRQIVLYNLHH